MRRKNDIHPSHELWGQINSPSQSRPPLWLGDQLMWTSTINQQRLNRRLIWCTKIPAYPCKCILSLNQNDKVDIILLTVDGWWWSEASSFYAPFMDSIYLSVITSLYRCLWLYERGPKLRVTKAVMSKSYRFRSLAMTIYMAWEHVKQRLLAVCCLRLPSKCGRNFPQNSLAFCTVACLLLLRILFISLDL